MEVDFTGLLPNMGRVAGQVRFVVKREDCRSIGWPARRSQYACVLGRWLCIAGAESDSAGPDVGND